MRACGDPGFAVSHEFCFPASGTTMFTTCTSTASPSWFNCVRSLLQPCSGRDFERPHLDSPRHSRTTRHRGRTGPLAAALLRGPAPTNPPRLEFVSLISGYRVVHGPPVQPSRQSTKIQCRPPPPHLCGKAADRSGLRTRGSAPLSNTHTAPNRRLAPLQIFR